MYDEISTSLVGMVREWILWGCREWKVPPISFSLSNFPCCEKVYCFGTTSSTKDPMKVRILTERVMFFWLHPLKHIVMSKSSSHVTGFHRLTQPAVGSRGRHLQSRRCSSRSTKVWHLKLEGQCLSPQGVDITAWFHLKRCASYLVQCDSDDG